MLATHSSHVIDLQPERESDIARILGLIERNALKMMKMGGGGLTRPQKFFERVTEANKIEMVNLYNQGHTPARICEITHFSHATVWRYTRPCRGVKGTR